jgi:acetyltransferase-like isoleucine patch superfamily enzyme
VKPYERSYFVINQKFNIGEGYGFVRNILRGLHATCRRILAKNDIGRESRIALRAYVDLTNPRGVHIGDGTLIETGAAVLAHDPSRHFHAHTCIGRNCLIGTRAVIMAGVTVGDQSIVLPGSIVKTNVPSGSVVAGSPARVMRSGIRTGKYGLLLDPGVSASASELGVEGGGCHINVM